VLVWIIGNKFASHCKNKRGFLNWTGKWMTLVLILCFLRVIFFLQSDRILKMSFIFSQYELNVDNDNNGSKCACFTYVLTCVISFDRRFYLCIQSRAMLCAVVSWLEINRNLSKGVVTSCTPRKTLLFYVLLDFN